MFEVAKGACEDVTAAVDVAFLDPTPWMRRAFGYTRAPGKNRDEVEADVYILPSLSIVLKYGMGDGPQVRRPGDVGLAKDVIYVPNWKNLQLTQGINRNSYGNLPGGVAAREALGSRAKRQRPGRWGIYKGEVDVGGSRVMGYIARPPARDRAHRQERSIHSYDPGALARARRRARTGHLRAHHASPIRRGHARGR